MSNLVKRTGTFPAGREAAVRPLSVLGGRAIFTSTRPRRTTTMHTRSVERVIDLTDPARNAPGNLTLAEARARVAAGDIEGVRAIAGSFALVATSGQLVRMARSL